MKLNWIKLQLVIPSGSTSLQKRGFDSVALHTNVALTSCKKYLYCLWVLEIYCCQQYIFTNRNSTMVLEQPQTLVSLHLKHGPLPWTQRREQLPFDHGESVFYHHHHWVFSWYKDQTQTDDGCNRGADAWCRTNYRRFSTRLSLLETWHLWRQNKTKQNILDNVTFL